MIVKNQFISLIRDYASQNQIKSIYGAVEFFNYLRQQYSVKVAIVTGGWLESAEIKLNAAGFDISGIPVSSSDKYHDRKEIIKDAAQRSGINKYYRKYYFGDGEWDALASTELGYNFIGIGNRINSNQIFTSYLPISEVARYVGL